MSFYSILCLDSSASFEEIKEAYRALALTTHPDKTRGKGNEEFIKIKQVKRRELIVLMMSIKLLLWYFNALL